MHVTLVCGPSVLPCRERADCPYQFLSLAQVVCRLFSIAFTLHFIRSCMSAQYSQVVPVARCKMQTVVCIIRFETDRLRAREWRVPRSRGSKRKASDVLVILSNPSRGSLVFPFLMTSQPDRASNLEGDRRADKSVWRERGHRYLEDSCLNHISYHLPRQHHRHRHATSERISISARSSSHLSSFVIALESNLPRKRTSRPLSRFRIEPDASAYSDGEQ